MKFKFSETRFAHHLKQGFSTAYKARGLLYFGVLGYAVLVFFSLFLGLYLNQLLAHGYLQSKHFVVAFAKAWEQGGIHAVLLFYSKSLQQVFAGVPLWKHRLIETIIFSVVLALPKLYNCCVVLRASAAQKLNSGRVRVRLKSGDARSYFKLVPAACAISLFFSLLTTIIVQGLLGLPVGQAIASLVGPHIAAYLPLQLLSVFLFILVNVIIKKAQAVVLYHYAQYKGEIMHSFSWFVRNMRRVYLPTLYYSSVLSLLVIVVVASAAYAVGELILQLGRVLHHYWPVSTPLMTIAFIAVAVYFLYLALFKAIPFVLSITGTVYAEYEKKALK